MTSPTLHTVESGRVRIDDIDAEIVRLVRERTSVSGQIQAARQLTGGRPGATIAMALLELGRGRPA